MLGAMSGGGMAFMLPVSMISMTGRCFGRLVEPIETELLNPTHEVTATLNKGTGIGDSEATIVQSVKNILIANEPVKHDLRRSLLDGFYFFVGKGSGSTCR